MSTSFLFTRKQVDSDYANAKSQLSILLRVVARHLQFKPPITNYHIVAHAQPIKLYAQVFFINVINNQSLFSGNRL